MRKAISKGAVVESPSIKRQNRLFTVPKKDTTELRVILDLSALNKFILCMTFKMTTISHVRNILPNQAWTCSIDLKDAFWHVPIAPSFQGYLGFSLDNITYRFKAMPFGLNIAPRVFTKLGNIVVQFLRQKGIPVVAYLDDWLIWGNTLEDCQHNTSLVVKELQRRGFILNLEKSRLTPSRAFKWLGIHWNLNRGRISMTPARRRETQKSVRLLLNQGFISRRQLEKIIGLLNFCSIIDLYLKACLKEMSRFLLSHASRRKRDMKVPFPKQLKNLLRPWSKASSLGKSVSLRPKPISVTIHSDASKWGWGGHTEKK
ncbi:MAG: reverse transcriptase domain-containing protein, partial [Bacteroidota bacterium]